MFDAAKGDDLAKVKALVEREVSLITLKDAAGDTPLHQAAITGSVSITELLVSKGADRGLYISFKGKDGQWGQSIKLPKSLMGVCPMVSPDGKFLFIDIRWVSSKLIEELRPKE